MLLPSVEIKIRYETVAYIPCQVLIAEQQGALILRLMVQFARDFVASIEGTKVGVSKTSIMLLYYSCKDWSRVYRRTSVSAYFIQSEIGNNLMGTRLWQLEWKNSPKFGRYAIANQILPSLNPLPKPQEQTRSIWPRHPMPNRSLVHRRIQKIRPNPWGLQDNRSIPLPVILDTTAGIAALAKRVYPKIRCLHQNCWIPSPFPHIWQWTRASCRVRAKVWTRCWWTVQPQTHEIGER